MPELGEERDSRVQVADRNDGRRLSHPLNCHVSEHKNAGEPTGPVYRNRLAGAREMAGCAVRARKTAVEDAGPDYGSRVPGWPI
jgi:hypothetical protein